MAANDTQVGGSHYRVKEGEQHWDRQWRLFGPGYFVGCITKYVERYLYKNGLEDLLKARHFLDKLIELEEAKHATERVPNSSVTDGMRPVASARDGSDRSGGTNHTITP